MALGNTTETYGSASRGVHWFTVALIVAVFGLAWTMTEMANSPDKFRLYGLHKSIGATILALGLFRIVWTVVQPSPRVLGNPPRWQEISAKAVHGLLLLWLVVMPLSGWVMSSAGGHPVSVFGLFTLPNLVGVDREFAHTVKEGHELLANLGLFLIAAHVGAALWHHVVVKDGTLRRMLPAFAGGCDCTEAACNDEDCGCEGKGKGHGPKSGGCGCGTH